MASWEVVPELNRHLRGKIIHKWGLSIAMFDSRRVNIYSTILELGAGSYHRMYPLVNDERQAGYSRMTFHIQTTTKKQNTIFTI